MDKKVHFACGVVVSALGMRTVQVRTAKLVYNDFLRKHFRTYENLTVSDPNSSARTGDVVRIADGWRASRKIRHILTEIVTPWGPPLEIRPKTMSLEEARERMLKKQEAQRQGRAQRKKQEIAGKTKSEAVRNPKSPGGMRLGAPISVAKSRRGRRARS